MLFHILILAAYFYPRNTWFRQLSDASGDHEWPPEGSQFCVGLMTATFCSFYSTIKRRRRSQTLMALPTFRVLKMENLGETFQERNASADDKSKQAKVGTLNKSEFARKRCS